MARVTSATVESLLADNYDGSTDLDQFIGLATRMVDRLVTCAALKSVTFSTDELADIEKLLAAHFYQMSDEGYTSKSTGKASGSFKGQFADGLKRTTYGQSALILDPSGCLAAASSGARAGGTWLGKPKSDQLDYDERN